MSEEMERALRSERKEQRKKAAKRRKQVSLLLLLCAFIAGGLFLWERRKAAAKEPLPPAAGETSVTVLNVGQGLAVLIRSQGETMLVDGGSPDASSRTAAYLKNQGITELKYLAVTHYDADHMGGAIAALAVCRTENVLAPDYEKEGRLYESFIRRIEEEGIPLIHPETGESYTLGSCRFTVMGPCSSRYEEENDRSLVIRLTDGSHSLMITGDAEALSEQDMVFRYAGTGLLKSDVLVLGHHGSSSSTSGLFLTAVRPEAAILSCGADNEYGHPHREVMDRLRTRHIPLCRTDTQGDICLSFTPEGIVWQTGPGNDYHTGHFPEKENTADTAA